ncbi:MAG: hypothetical protein QS98_C0009G0023 [archaeon GW2011_AR3]|nr:MAG: hypothetical protein QS98_C0009G0023 [archaeon GW2011_AR3]MBS3110327.1 hypothetical protein [Candidatus Woesearchaeota archaeon]
MKRATTTAFIIGALLLVGAWFVFAAPDVADSVTLVNSSGRTEGTSGTTVQALAGNVSLLVINNNRTTERWQGYFGNVTGAISLSDSSNNILYDWKIASPRGEIYASNTSTVTWTNITCFNFTKVAASQRVTLSMLEGSLGMATNDQDGVNETFNNSFGGSFSVGDTTINTASGCSAAYMFTSNGEQYVDYVEVLLTDNSTENVVYTALLEQDATGFTGDSFDFEMIVGENGDDSAVTNYYFFAELT